MTTKNQHSILYYIFARTGKQIIANSNIHKTYFHYIFSHVDTSKNAFHTHQHSD